MSGNTAISVVGLRKRYGEHEVLTGVDLEVPEGSVYALLGPNGAGKTTAVNICSTLLTADAGEVVVAGFDVRTHPDLVRRAIGVTGQFSAIDDFHTGRENLRLMADLGHLDRGRGRRVVDELLERFGLADAADRRALTYSGGMKRRLDLAMTLVGSPRLIFLDEPTAGLDPRSRRSLWEIVREQVAEGVTVLLTTQYLDEADQLADRVGLLDGGRIVAEGAPAQLKTRVPGGRVEVRFTDGAALAEVAAVLPAATVEPTTLTLRLTNDGVASLRRLLDLLDDASVADLTVRSADLDDVFLALTGHEALTGQGTGTGDGRRRQGGRPMRTRTPAPATTDHVVRDSVTMLRRNLLHWIRYPSLAVMLLAQPTAILLLFVYVFGGTLGAGLPGVPGGGDRGDYLAFITPGILVMAVASVALGTAIEVALDMTGGIIARFRTMDIAQVSVLTGHVLGAVLKTMLAVLVTILVAVLLGYRSDAGAEGWLTAFALLVLMAVAFTWLTVAMGLAADSVETASNTPMVLVVLPFVSSGFVPTDAMPWGLRHFAEHQPFTPMVDSLRALTSGADAGSDLWLAVAWSLLIAVLGYLWARRLFTRVPTR